MNNHIHPLTGLRGIAALWVVLLHGADYTQISNVLPTLISNVINKGWIGVDLFFVLSGFVIAYVHQKDFDRLTFHSIGNFLVLRLARIYPAHLIATLILVPLVLGATVLSLYQLPESSATGYGIDRLIFSLTLTNGWGIADSAGWNWPSWSVGSEWFAYLTFPFIAFGLNRVSRLTTFIAAIFGMIGVMYLAAFIVNGGQQYMPVAEFTLLRVTSAFFIGCCLFNIYIVAPKKTFGDLVPALVIGSVLVLSAYGFPSIFDGFFILLFVALILSLSRNSGAISGFLSGNVLKYLGEISYSVYLIHYTVLIGVNQVFERTVERFGLLEVGDISYLVAFYSVFIMATLFAGHMLYSLVENPCRQAIRDRWVARDMEMHGDTFSSGVSKANS